MELFKKLYDALIDPENQGAQRMVDKYFERLVRATRDYWKENDASSDQHSRRFLSFSFSLSSPREGKCASLGTAQRAACYPRHSIQLADWHPEHN